MTHLLGFDQHFASHAKRIVHATLFALVIGPALLGPGPARAEVDYAVRFAALEVGGDWARALERGWSGEFAVRGTGGLFEPGVAVQFGSHDMPAPNSEATWSHLTLAATLAIQPWQEQTLAPFAELRVGWTRLRPESELFLDDVDVDLEPGENPFEALEGLEFSIVAGTSITVGHGLRLELGASAGLLASQKADLSAVGQTDAGSGTLIGLRFGLVWGR